MESIYYFLGPFLTGAGVVIVLESAVAFLAWLPYRLTQEYRYRQMRR
jgi:hypothetical protein